MVAVRLRGKRGEAAFELMELGPVRYLRDNILLLSQRQFEVLKEMKIRYELVSSEEVQEKMKGVIFVPPIYLGALTQPN